MADDESEHETSSAFRAMLVQAREHAGLKRGELAVLLGISEVQIGRIETGSRGTSADRARRWLEACGQAIQTTVVGDPKRASLLASALADLTEAQLQTVARVVRAWPRLSERARDAILLHVEAVERD